jgi:hypothetical protein
VTDHPRGTDALSSVVDRTSERWRRVAVVAVAFAVATVLLMLAGEAFRDVTGFDPFDLQNSPTADEIRAQLASYPDAATGRYLVFAAIDVVFPLVGALLLASVTAACVRRASPGVYGRALRSHLFLLFLVPTLFDWTENVFAVWLVVAGDPASDFAVDALLLAKSAKLITLVVSQVTCTAAIVWWLISLVRSRSAAARA